MSISSTLAYVRRGLGKGIHTIRRQPSITPGEFDLTTLPQLLGKDDPLILDIGCNDGSHTREFLRLFTDAKVYAFEPDPRALESFARNVTDPRAQLFALAIADMDGTTEFHLSDGRPPGQYADLRPTGWDLSGSIKKPKKHLEIHPWCTFERSQIVKTRRLDSWCSEHAIQLIDFIWADVQGAEEDLIRGGRQALRRTHYFYTEYSNEELYENQITLRRLQKLLPDFQLVQLFANDALFQNMKWKQ